jgi:hypothetical protein
MKKEPLKYWTDSPHRCPFVPMNQVSPEPINTSRSVPRSGGMSSGGLPAVLASTESLQVWMGGGARLEPRAAGLEPEHPRSDSVIDANSAILLGVSSKPEPHMQLFTTAMKPHPGTRADSGRHEDEGRMIFEPR